MRDVADILGGRLAITHGQLVAAAESCTDDDLTWQPGPTAPPIGFHLWHSGRWADRWAQAIATSLPRLAVAAGAAGQRWEREDLAAGWGFPASLGKGDTGMELPDDEAASLPFPGSDAVAGYLRDAFGDLEAVVAQIEDAELTEESDDLLGGRAPLGDSLIRHHSHVSRHLGMIEALRGLRGGHGTATV
jgi:hypothetical protein